ncbi:MAG: peptidase S58 family protein [Rhodococcus sp. (in: high G+C Gram-positive bacteria)]|nr:MAG: peptidase S58 family protein [Rhodococcus sp. (in: high G+C Gram-positive bacteria)]
MTATTPGRTDSLVDVVGLSVGHHHELDGDATLGSGAATGCTVVLAPHGATGAVDVRGGGPGTRETDLLDPSHSVRRVHAIVLTGGSAYGLAAADGVMRWLEEHGHGIAMGEPDQVVPIVPAAVIFDLPVGDWRTRPTAEFGYRAADSASHTVLSGSVGAGVGARAGALKGGVGTASVVVTDGPAKGITVKAALRRVAVAGHDGLARAIRPAHSPLDGDTIFALSTGIHPVHHPPGVPDAFPPDLPVVDAVCTAAAEVVEKAIVDAVLSATPVAGIPTYRELFPSALRS